jgi:hypothetical protein
MGRFTSFDIPFSLAPAPYSDKMYRLFSENLFFPGWNKKKVLKCGG